MAERFNRRLAEAIRSQPAIGDNAGKNRFRSHADRNAFILNVTHDYNRTRLKCLGYKAPLECLLNQAEDNTKAGTQKAGAAARRRHWVPAFAGMTRN
jgi:hypothetical protein